MACWVDGWTVARNFKLRKVLCIKAVLNTFDDENHPPNQEGRNTFRKVDDGLWS